jgi:hypothetical protein
MLPVTATAQQRRTSGDRQAVQRQSEQSEERRGDRSGNRDPGSGNRGDRDQRSNATQQRQQNWSLPSIGLPPATPSNRMPSWEQNRTPSWEQKQTPWWERQGQPVWERQQPHQPSWARDLKEAQDRRLGKTTGRPGRHAPPAVVYVLPPYRYFPNDSIYGYGVSSSTAYVSPPPPNVVTMYPPATEPPPAEVTTGFLKLEVEPRQLLQVFVDGVYVGSLADLGDEIELRLGTRRIELRAPGYRTLIFDTEIVPDRTVVYRGVLEAMAPAAPPSAAPSPASPGTPSSRTIYVIPGCYMGNVAPKAADLRPSCDINKVQKIEP